MDYDFYVVHYQAKNDKERKETWLVKINAEGDVRIHYVTSTNKEILFINRFFFQGLTSNEKYWGTFENNRQFSCFGNRIT